MTKRGDTGSAGEQVRHHGCGVHQLLEVVEHEQQFDTGVLDLQLLLQPLARVDRGERDEARAVAELAREPVGQLEREPRLAHTARPEDRHQPHARVAQQRGDRIQLGIAADQVGRARGERGARDGGCAPGRRRRELERRILCQHRGLEPLQLRARLEPQVVHQHAPGAAERVERVGLAAGAVQRQHQVCVQLLAIRVLGDQRLELGDRSGVLAEREVQLQPVLERGEPHAVETGALRRGAPEQLDVGQRRAAEQRERGAQCLRRSPQVTGSAEPARLVQVALEVLEVELAGRQLDRVAGRPGDDRLAVAERPPQLGDVHLQSLGGGGRRVVSPQLVDQPFGRDDSVAVVEEQDGEQRSSLGSGHGDLLARRPHAQRAQDLELHRLTGALPARCRLGPRCVP